MKVCKLTTYPAPAYPDRDQVARSPELLLTLPQRWRRNGRACAAFASVTAMLLSACAGPGEADSTAQDAAIAPLFTHGDGRGGYGCVSVAPPAFLSESEAYAVVAQMAREAGLELRQPGPVLTNVRLPQVDPYSETAKTLVGTKIGDLELDGVDSAGKVAFEFVSTADLGSWEKPDDGVHVSYEFYNFQEAADALRDGLRKARPGMAVGVLYDPSYAYNDEIEKILDESDYEDAARKIKELVKADLREQVKDFLAWLKAQGIV